MPEVVVTFRAENEEAILRAFDRVSRNAQVAARSTNRASQSLGTGVRQSTQQVNFLNRTLAATNNLLATAGSRIASRVFIVGAAIAFVRILAQIQEGFQAIISEGFRFNRQLEQNAIALTAIIGATRELAIAGEQTVTAIMFYPILLEAARIRQREILFLSIETLGTAEDLTGVYQRLLSFTSTQLATDNERLTLASNLLNISRLIGLNAAETLIEIRQLTTLDNQRGQAVLQVLGLNIQQLRNWKEQGVLVQRLNEALEPIRAIGREIGQSFQGVFESVRSLFGITSGDAFADIFRGALDILRGVRDRLREISEQGGLSQIVDVSPAELEQFGRSLGNAIVTISQNLARLTADFIEFLAQNPGFIDGLLRFLQVLELTIRGTVRAIARIFEFLDDLIQLFIPATERLTAVAERSQGFSPAGSGQRNNLSPSEELVSIVRALPEGVLTSPQGSNDLEALARVSDRLNTSGITFSDAVDVFTAGVRRDISERAQLLGIERASDLFISRETIDLFSEALQQQTVSTEDALNKITDVLVNVPAEIIRRTDTAQALLSPAAESGPLGDLRDLFTTRLPISRPGVDLDRVSSFFAESSRSFAAAVRSFQSSGSSRESIEQFSQNTLENIQTFITNFPSYVEEAGLALFENIIPIITSTAVGAAVGASAGGPPGAAVGGFTGAFIGFRGAGSSFTERLARLETRQQEAAGLAEIASPEGVAEIVAGLDNFAARLNEILEGGFQDRTLPEIAGIQAEVATIRQDLVPFQEQARRIIQADPADIPGGEQVQTFLREALSGTQEFSTRFVELLRTVTRSLEESSKAALTLQRQFSEAVATQIQARFQIGLGSVEEFISTQTAQVDAVQQANLSRVGTNRTGIETANDLARFQTQNVFTTIPGLVGQQAQFNIEEESRAVTQITQERQAQLEIQMQAGQSAIAVISQERAFLDLQRTSLQEQTALVEREGTLRRQQIVTSRENLTLQAADRAARLEILQRELAQAEVGIDTARQEFLATPGGVDAGAVEEFNQAAAITLDNITNAISNLMNELNGLNASILNTQVSAELLANQTAEDVRSLIANRPGAVLGNQQEQDDIALATLRRATSERRTQLELRNQESQIVLQAVNADLSYLQSRGNSLSEQIELVRLSGQLRIVQAETELQSLRLQRTEAQERLNITRAQIQLYSDASGISRELLQTTPGTTPTQIAAFDANAASDLSNLADSAAAASNDILRINGALGETAASIRQVGVDTTRTIDDISHVTINLGNTIRDALSQFAIGLARGTTDLDALAGTLADSIENSFISGFTEALTAKLSFDRKIMQNLADLSGEFEGFGDFVGEVLGGVFGAAGVATNQFGQGVEEIFNATFRGGAPIAESSSADASSATLASAAVLGAAESAAMNSADATAAANQAANAAGATVQVTASAQSTILGGLVRIGQSLENLGSLIVHQLSTSFGAEVGGGSNTARAGAQLGGTVGGSFGRVIGTVFGGPLGGVAGGFIGDFLGSILGGFIGGLFAPGRIELEKRAIRGDLRQGLSFEPDFGSGYVGTNDPDRRALEAIGTFRALDEIRRNDERGQGTVQRFANQAIHAFENAGLTVIQRQEEIFRLAQQNNLDNPINVLVAFRTFDQEHGFDEIIESRQEGLEEGNLVTRGDILAGAIDIYSQFEERIDSVAIANGFLADAFAKLRPEALETIAGIRDGTILVEDAAIALGVTEGEISGAFDDEGFLRYLELAQIGVDALTKAVLNLTSALDAVDFARSGARLQEFDLLEELGAASPGERIPFLEEQRDTARDIAEREEARIVPFDELDFSDRDAVDRNLEAFERARAAREREAQLEADIFAAHEGEVRFQADAEIAAAEERARGFTAQADEQRALAEAPTAAAAGQRAQAEMAQDTADDFRDLADAQLDLAQDYHDLADEQQELADEQRDLAEEQLDLAQVYHDLADEQRELADEQRELAEEQLDLAQVYHDLADEQQELADEQRELADEQLDLAQVYHDLADEQRELADEQRELADEQLEYAQEQHDLADEQREFAAAATESAREASEAARHASEAARDASEAAATATQIADSFINAVEAAANVIEDLLTSISTLPANEARLQRQAADIENQLAGTSLTPEERADAYRQLVDIQQQRGQLFLEDDPIGGQARVRTDVIPELENIQERARREEIPFREEADEQTNLAAMFEADAERNEAVAVAFTAQAEAYTAQAEAFVALAEPFEAQAEAYVKQAEAFEDQAEAFRELAEPFEEQAEAYIEQAEAYEDQAEAFRELAEPFEDQAEAYIKQAEAFEDQADAFRELAEPFEEQAEAYIKQAEAFEDQADAFRELAEPFEDQAEAYIKMAESFEDQADIFIKAAEGYEDQARHFIELAEGFERQAADALRAAEGAFERIAEEYGLDDYRNDAISNIQAIYASIDNTLKLLRNVVLAALGQAEDDRDFLVYGPTGSPETGVDTGADTDTAADMTDAADAAADMASGASTGSESSVGDSGFGRTENNGLPPGAYQQRPDGVISIGIGSFITLPQAEQDRLQRYNVAVQSGREPGPYIQFAQTGFQGTIRQPTLFQAGEGGFPEDVIIRPRRLGGLFNGQEGGDSDGQDSGGGGELRVSISIDLRGATGISANEVAEQTVEKLLDTFREDLRTGVARQIVREEIL